MLADRYLLVDLLTESGGGRFWRAEDRVLDRHVALHCIAEDDGRAERLTEAARLSATVLDRRILRVLDADRRAGMAYVVNEWGTGTSLDIMVASEGPLPPRRAAWIVSEVAAAMATAHDQRVAHGRLVPENVLVDESGSVRVIGFCVDAALLGLGPGELSTDVTDLGALLHFLLTGKWAGPSPSAVPTALRKDRRWLRPRQVRAGIPRVLDSICDQVLNPFDAPPTGWPHNLNTARGLCQALRDHVGDPAGLAVPVPLHGVHGAGALAVPERRERPVPDPEPDAEPDETAVVAPVEDTPDPETTSDTGAGDDGPTEPAHTVVMPTAPPPGTPPPREPGSEPPPEPAAPGDLPTQAGMPVFDDDNDDVTWLERRSQPPPPPPVFEDPPERPLFAPEPADGGPSRRPRPGAVATRGSDYWPWDTGTGAGSGSGVIPVTEDDPDDEVPGRSWFRLAAVIALSLLLLVAVVIAYNLGRGKTPLGAEPDPEPTESSATSAPAPSPIEIAGASDLDPQGDPPEEYPELAALAVDGDPATSWRTSTYDDQLGPPPGLKTGVGLSVDLGRSQQVSQIDLTVVGTPTGVTYYLTDQEPTAVGDLEPLASAKLDQPRGQARLDEPATGRYLVVWLTRLPAVSDGFRGEIAEVEVSG